MSEQESSASRLGFLNDKCRKAFSVALAATASAGLLYGGYKLYNYAATHVLRNRMLQQYRSKLILGKSGLEAIKRDFITQLETGLKQDIPTSGRHMLMLPTFVTQLPTGLETGDVYAIDMGGTNFRVMHVQLSDDRSKVVSQDTHEVAIPKEVYTGPGTGLFDFLAAELKAFIEKHGGCSSMRDGGDPVVGFCFSFPTSQTALDQGKLLDWTKGFTCTGVVGEDPVRLLSEALVRAGRPCRIACLLNDTVGVLAAHRYLEPSTSVGVIVGTGTNACYVEQQSKLSKWQAGEAQAVGDGQTAINIEWGAFHSQHLPRCAEDDHVDQATAHGGKYLFEKLISGMFLGEVARRILLQITADTALFGNFGADPAAARAFACLANPGSFTTAHLARVVEDRSPMLSEVSAVLAETMGVDVKLAPFSTRQVVYDVCEMVALRSAQMVSVGLDALLTHSGWDGSKGKNTIAFDGGVWEKFATYRVMVYRTLEQLRGPGDMHHLDLVLSHDGSCLGAAVLAAAAVASGTAKSQPHTNNSRSTQTPAAVPTDAKPAVAPAAPPVTAEAAPASLVTFLEPVSRATATSESQHSEAVQEQEPEEAPVEQQAATTASSAAQALETVTATPAPPPPAAAASDGVATSNVTAAAISTINKGSDESQQSQPITSAAPGHTSTSHDLPNGNSHHIPAVIVNGGENSQQLTNGTQQESELSAVQVVSQQAAAAATITQPEPGTTEQQQPGTTEAEGLEHQDHTDDEEEEVAAGAAGTTSAGNGHDVGTEGGSGAAAGKKKKRKGKGKK